MDLMMPLAAAGFALGLAGASQIAARRASEAAARPLAGNDDLDRSTAGHVKILFTKGFLVLPSLAGGLAGIIFYRRAAPRQRLHIFNMCRSGLLILKSG